MWRSKIEVSVLKAQFAIAMFVFSLLVVTSADATARTYNDGGTHIFSGVDTDGLVISNNTTVSVAAEAILILGRSGGTGGDAAIRLEDNSTLNVAGGLIRGGNGVTSGGAGVTGFGFETLTVSGGIIRGGEGQTSGGVGLGGAEFETLTISGGTFEGGNGGTSGGDGLIFANFGSVLISGGEFSGASAGVFDKGNGAAARFLSAGSATISGGTFRGGSGGVVDLPDLFANGDIVINLTGGTFSGPGGIRLAGNSVLNVFGALTFRRGVLAGTLADGSSIQEQVTLFENAQLNLIPEPCSLALATFSLVVLGCRSHMRALLRFSS